MDDIELPTVPARVGKLRIIKHGPVPSPMRWQRTEDAWTRTDMDVRYMGVCIVCERNTYQGGSGDPRGPIGQNTYSPIDELEVRVCAICGGDGDTYRQAQAIIRQRGVEACAPIAWPAGDPAATSEEENWTTYRVVRKFADEDGPADQVIAVGLTHEQAVAHCNNPQTSSRTATDPDMVAITEKYGDWSDGWESL